MLASAEVCARVAGTDSCMKASSRLAREAIAVCEAAVCTFVAAVRAAVKAIDVKNLVSIFVGVCVFVVRISDVSGKRAA